MVALDENYAIIVGKCSKVKLPYLMKYERLENSPLDNAIFQYVGVYPAEKDYVDWSDNRPNHSKISTSQLWGGGGCPIVVLLLVCVCATVGKFSVLTAKKKSSALVVMKPCILMMKQTVLILILRVQGARDECNRTIRKNKILVKSG